MTTIIADLSASAKDAFAGAQFRDQVDNGRKVAIQILDFFDRYGALRKGDERRINRIAGFVRCSVSIRDERGGNRVRGRSTSNPWGSEPVPVAQTPRLSSANTAWSLALNSPAVRPAPTMAGSPVCLVSEVSWAPECDPCHIARAKSCSLGQNLMPTMNKNSKQVFIAIPIWRLHKPARRRWPASINQVSPWAVVGAMPMAQTAMDPSRRPVANSMHHTTAPSSKPPSLFAATPRCRRRLNCDDYDRIADLDRTGSPCGCA